jgi:hypothetical protein
VIRREDTVIAVPGHHGTDASDAAVGAADHGEAIERIEGDNRHFNRMSATLPLP